MKKIDRNSKILVLAHNDLDAAVSSIVLQAVYTNISFTYHSFNKIDNFLENLDYSKWDWIFIVDIHPVNDKLIDNNKIVLLDHHKSSEHLNNPSKMKFVITSINAAMLCKRFVENMYNIKLDYLNSLVYLSMDYDLYTLKNGKSKLINDLCFFYYRPIKFRETFKTGRTRFNKEELKWLHKRRDEYKDAWKNLEVYDLQKINGCIVEANNFLNEIASDLMNQENYRIVFVRNPSNGRISLRHNINNFDAGTFLKEKEFGGGHELAAGIITESDKDLQNKINVIEEYVYNNFIETRRN